MAKKHTSVVESEVKPDENGGHGYIEFGSIGGAVVQVFYADDNERRGNNDNRRIQNSNLLK